MDIQIGLYAVIFIFFFLIIPGFAARRFYYHGEFSKQMRWTSNILTHLFYSLSVGILLTLSFVFLYNLISHDPIDIDDILRRFDSNLLKEDTPETITDSDRFSGFTKSLYKFYIPFLAGVYFFCASVGYFVSKIVLFFNLDTRWKLLRYNNNWHYLFSGRLLGKAGSDNEVLKKVKYTYLDILVAEVQKETLYSGLLADYDLSFSECDKLEKIHLYRASKYVINSEGKFINRPIPGSVFTINAEKILNINTTYFWDDTEIPEKKYVLLVPFQIIVVLLFLFFMITITLGLKIMNAPWYTDLINQTVFVRILIAYTINVSMGLLTPYKVNHENRKVVFNGWESVIVSAATALALIILLKFFLFQT